MSVIRWDAAEISRGLDRISECRQQLLAEFKTLLDDYNGWSQPVDYYDIVAGDWLEHFAHLVYAAMVEATVSDCLDGRDHPIPVTSDIRAYDELRVTQSGLERHLKAVVVRLLAGQSPGNWTFSANSTRISSGNNRRPIDTAIRSMATNRPTVLLVAPYFKCGPAEIAATLMRWRKWAALDRLEYPINFMVELNPRWRLDRAVSAGQATDLLGALKILLPLHLPVGLLEGYANFRQASLAIPIPRPKAVYSANALHGQLMFKVLAAEWRKEGTHLLYHQHGGCYGIDRIHVLEDYERRVADRYFTWGWHKPYTANLVPMSPSMLHRPRHRRSLLLLICVDHPVNVYRLQFQPMPGTIETMHRETCNFLAALPDAKDWLVRPYSNDYSGSFVDRMRRAAPTARFDDRRASSFHRYAQSRLVVHNYLATGYLETLALNTPTVCFYDPDAYAFRSSAQPFMDELERVGILHRSGRSAAHFVSSVLCDLDGWWRAADVQEARRRFVAQFANFAPDWKQQWDREFHRALAEMTIDR